MTLLNSAAKGLWRVDGSNSPELPQHEDAQSPICAALSSRSNFLPTVVCSSGNVSRCESSAYKQVCTGQG